jgi:hypothetical protein
MTSSAKKAGIAAAVLSTVVFGLVFGLLIIKLMWSWVIPDIFPGAVKQGLIVKSISWYMAFKLALFIAMLGGIARLSVGCRSDE